MVDIFIAHLTPNDSFCCLYLNSYSVILVWAAERGKKTLMQNEKLNFLKHGKIRNSTSLTNLKQNQQPFLKNQQASMQNKRSPMLNQQSCTGLTLDGVQRGTCTCTLEKT